MWEWNLVTLGVAPSSEDAHVREAATVLIIAGLHANWISLRITPPSDFVPPLTHHNELLIWNYIMDLHLADSPNPHFRIMPCKQSKFHNYNFLFTLNNFHIEAR